MNSGTGANNGDRPPSDPTLRALGAAELAELRHVEQVEAAVDRGDVDALRQLLGTSKKDAEAMMVRLRPPDAALREAWLDRWDASRKTRRFTPRIMAAVGGSLAAAAVVLIVAIPGPSKRIFPEASAEIVSAPAHHLSGSAPTVAPDIRRERHRDVAGDLLRIALVSSAQPLEELEAVAYWKVGDVLDPWTIPVKIERDDETHSTVGVKIPDDARGEGTLILLVARKGDLPNSNKAREECIRPSANAPWRVVVVEPPLVVEPNIPGEEKLSP